METRLLHLKIKPMALYREQPEPYVRSEKRRKRHSYKWAKRQMNKWLRLKNKRIEEDDTVPGYRKKVWYGYEY